MERHRLQYLVIQAIAAETNLRGLRILQVAPEPFFKPILKAMFGAYDTANLDGTGVDFREDLTHLSFADESTDVVYASHVLEHIRDDAAALREIRRVLRPGAIAFLPVPKADRRNALAPSRRRETGTPTSCRSAASFPDSDSHLLP